MNFRKTLQLLRNFSIPVDLHINVIDCLHLSFCPCFCLSFVPISFHGFLTQKIELGNHLVILGKLFCQVYL